MYVADSRANADPSAVGTRDSAGATGTPDAPSAAGGTGIAGARGTTGTTARVSAAIAPTVFALGAVSLITDVSSEMVTAVLPLYLVTGLGLSPLGFGLLDGIYNGFSALVRLAGGHLADRGGGRHKWIAGLGYGISALCKPLLLLAHTLTPIGLILAADRTGKGLRTAPRDALISLSSTPENRGRAFRRTPRDGHGGRTARPAGRVPDPPGDGGRVRRGVHGELLRGGGRGPGAGAVRAGIVVNCRAPHGESRTGEGRGGREGRGREGRGREGRRREGRGQEDRGQAGRGREGRAPDPPRRLRPPRPARPAPCHRLRASPRPGDGQRLLRVPAAATAARCPRPLVRAAAAGHGGGVRSCCWPCRWAGSRTGPAAGGCSSAATAPSSPRTPCC